MSKIHLESLLLAWIFCKFDCIDDETAKQERQESILTFHAKLIFNSFISWKQSVIDNSFDSVDSRRKVKDTLEVF